MTRHLYDISRLMDTEYLEKVISDRALYEKIIVHRSKLTKVSWVDYDKHGYSSLNFIPPKEIIDEYEKDYEAMKESMFYGRSDSFDDLMKKLKELNKKINKLE
jgi:hypothetical protein